MNKSLFLSIVMITACVLFPQHGWSGDLHFGGRPSGGYSGQFGGGHRGHFGGGHFSGGSPRFGGSVSPSFGSCGPYTNYGNPAYRSPSFGYSPYHSYPPYYGAQHSFRRGLPYYSRGFSRRSYGYYQGAGPAGPPPVGAPGPTPATPGTPTVTPPSFFCVEHGFRYANQQAFFGHLNFAHKIPLKNAAAYCQPTENGLIFPYN